MDSSTPNFGGVSGISEGRPLRPVDRFYRVTFADERGFRLWIERVVEFATILQDILPDLVDTRPVVFVELRPLHGVAAHAFVSDGARGLAAQISGGGTVDPRPVSASDLPRGLTMLFGEGIDAAEYERRQT